MTDNDTTVIQERIGQLRREFKMPTMGSQSVARFTESGHGDALPTFQEVLEQEAEERLHRSISRSSPSSRFNSSTPLDGGGYGDAHPAGAGIRSARRDHAASRETL